MRIQDKFFVRTAGAAVLVLLGFSGYVLYMQHLRIEAWFHERVGVATEVFSLATDDLLRTGDRETLEAFCAAYLSDPIVHAISITDASGISWLNLTTDLPDASRDSTYEMTLVVGQGDSQFTAHIIFTPHMLRRQQGPVALSLLIMIVTLPLVLFSTYWASSRKFSQRFKGVLAAMKKVDAGDYGTRLTLPGNDEFGQIGAYFDAMVSSIQRSDRRERDHARELEAKTRELEEEVLAKETTTEALRQSQKMEAVARLAGGVAHDFNNLLTSILGFSTMALQELGDDHPVSADIEEVLRSGERARDLTHKLLALGRKQPMDRHLIDLNVIIRGVVHFLKRAIGEDVELVTEMDPDIPSVLADAGSIEQVLVNLAVNARDAMPDGGRLYILSFDRHIDDAEARKLGDIHAGRYVGVSVRDTGKGMTDEVRNRVFEPFFTTKGLGKGTGLGLSTAYGIINQCGGTMVATSTVDQGSEFTIYLPAEGDESTTVQVQLVEQPVGGTETVLLVEDEDSVRRLATRLLSKLGYRVLEARYGAEGLTLARENTGGIDLILTDVVMPQLSGPDMVQQISTFSDDFKVLYMSGFTQDRRLLDSDGNEAQLLRKPFTQDQLARAVRDVLED